MPIKMLVSDVGGTNGRFAIAEIAKPNQLPSLTATRILQCAQFNSFSDMLQKYVDGLEEEIPKIARFAIAGEMTSRRGNLWHFNWNIDAGELEDTFAFERVKLMNDYEALVKVVPHLTSDELITLTPFREGLKKAPYSVFGIGSGLGAAIGAPRKSGPKIVPTEIGHSSFAPKTDLEQQLLSQTIKTHDHVSVETFLSGPGLIRIHNFLRRKAGRQEETITAAEITSAARENKSSICAQALELFMSILANTAGDIAISHGARGGIYIGGGIASKIASLISPEDFLVRFCDKGPMRNYLEKIPVHIISSELSALAGAGITRKY